MGVPLSTGDLHFAQTGLFVSFALGTRTRVWQAGHATIVDSIVTVPTLRPRFFRSARNWGRFACFQ